MKNSMECCEAVNGISSGVTLSFLAENLPLFTVALFIALKGLRIRSHHRICLEGRLCTNDFSILLFLQNVSAAPECPSAICCFHVPVFLKFIWCSSEIKFASYANFSLTG